MTRRYHGWLVAALPNPTGRAVMLTHLSEQLRLPDGRRGTGAPYRPAVLALVSFAG